MKKLFILVLMLVALNIYAIDNMRVVRLFGDNYIYIGNSEQLEKDTQNIENGNFNYIAIKKIHKTDSTTFPFNWIICRVNTVEKQDEYAPLFIEQIWERPDIIQPGGQHLIYAIGIDIDVDVMVICNLDTKGIFIMFINQSAIYHEEKKNKIDKYFNTSNTTKPISLKDIFFFFGGKGGKV